MQTPHTYLTKPFSEGNHAANDDAGKRTVISYLRSMGLDVIENPNRYGIDIMAARYEVERRTLFSPYFPYDTVHVPARKKKFFLHQCTYAVVLHHKLSDHSYDTLMFCDSDVITRYEPIEVPNRSMPTGEFFYDVPLSEWCIVDIPINHSFLRELNDII